MKCPKCGTLLIKVERNNVELDYCPECKGFFLDADEWFLIKNELKLPFDVPDILKVNSNYKGEKEKYIKCPICDKRMEKVEIGGIIIDRCLDYHGAWFDANELGAVISQNSTNTNEVIKFLGEIIHR